MTLPAALHGLLLPSAYPHRCSDIDCVETHISWVLRTGDYVYKLKKPVNLGFVDFSTRALRRHFCHEELRCNRRFAPELYLAVVPVMRRDGRVWIDVDAGAAPAVDAAAVATPVGRTEAGDRTDIVDYAVRMHQFPADAQLDRRLAAGRLSAAELDAFGRELADTHERLPSVAGAAPFGTADAVLAPMLENFSHLRGTRAADRHAHTLAALEDWTLRRHQALQPLLTTRREQGRIRECHGDLHLSNLVRLAGGIRAFDCIEFNEGLRWIDVISDVAFLVMDCLVRDRADLAYAFIDRYLETAGDYAGARLLGLYLVYRSLVRAKVAALQADASDDPSEADTLAARVAVHVELARVRAFESRPRLVVTCGYSGSGKSYLAARLVPLVPAIRIRSDVERRRLQGPTPGAAAAPPVGAGAYAADKVDAVYEHLAACAAAVVRGGDTAIVDATFLDPERRRRFARLANELGVPFIVLYAQAPVDVLRARVADREARGGDPSEATVAVLESQRATWRPPDPAQERLIVVDTAADPDLVAVAAALRAA